MVFPRDFRGFPRDFCAVVIKALLNPRRGNHVWFVKKPFPQKFRGISRRKPNLVLGGRWSCRRQLSTRQEAGARHFECRGYQIREKGGLGILNRYRYGKTHVTRQLKWLTNNWPSKGRRAMRSQFFLHPKSKRLLAAGTSLCWTCWF